MFSDQVSRAISQIVADNTSGAAELLGQTAAIFSLLQSDQPGASAEEARRAVLEACVALVRAQPAMSPLLKLASAAMSATEPASQAGEVPLLAEAAALTFIDYALRAAAAAASHAASLIGNGSRVLTHSRSSTVLEAFLAARRSGKRFSVIATESRPMLEGRALAESLAEVVGVTVIADAAAALALEDIDLVLMGADTITPGHVTNKIGTRMIALAARELGIPVYSVCDESKFICVDYLDRREGTPPELWPNAPAGITVANHYFETTPISYFSRIVTEDGALTIEDASRRAAAASINKHLLDALRPRG